MDRQTDRQAGKHVHTDRQTDRQTDKYSDTSTYRYRQSAAQVGGLHARHTVRLQSGMRSMHNTPGCTGTRLTREAVAVLNNWTNRHWLDKLALASLRFHLNVCSTRDFLGPCELCCLDGTSTLPSGAPPPPPPPPPLSPTSSKRSSSREAHSHGLVLC